MSETKNADPALVRIVEEWSFLPDAIRRAMVALLDAVGKQASPLIRPLADFVAAHGDSERANIIVQAAISDDMGHHSS